MTLSRILLLLISAVALSAQARLKFEVATIKPAAANAASNRIMSVEPNRIALQMTLRNLISYAFGSGLSTGLRVSGGPDWMDRNRYDVVGLAEGHPAQGEFRAMVRALLEERFALKTHLATEIVDVYALMPSRSDGQLGPKVAKWNGTCVGGGKPNLDDPKMPSCGARYRLPTLYLDGATMAAAAEMLSAQRQVVGRVVQDRTGLSGRYKMELEFQFLPPDPEGISIFTAVREQWGLKLEPAKGSVELVVVDRAELPTEN